MTTPYGFGTTLAEPYEEAIPRVKEALKAEGFGVLAEIDVRRTMREKLSAEMEPYLFQNSKTGTQSETTIDFSEQTPALSGLSGHFIKVL